MSKARVSSRRSGSVAQRFDRSAIRFNQALIIAFLLIGFVMNAPWLVVFVAAVMALGTAMPQAALFQRIYLDILRPARLLRP